MMLRQLHQLGIETYPFSLSDEMKRLPDHIRPLFNVDALIITLPPSSFSSQQYCEYLAFLTNQAKKQGVQHVLFTSSTSVFPDISGQFDDGSQLSAETEMGNTLIQAEQCLFQSGISHCDILRLAGLIGKQRHPVKFLAGKHNLKQGYSPVNLVSSRGLHSSYYSLTHESKWIANLPSLRANSSYSSRILHKSSSIL